MKGRQQQDLREVVAGLLGDPRLLAACAERDMGALFRLLNHRGVSTRRIAAAVDITQGRLYDYMNGKSRVEKLSVFEQIADALQIPGHLLGLARRSWEPQAPTPQKSVEIPPNGDDLAAMDAFRDADRQAGGGRLYGAVVRHLHNDVGPRLVDARSGLQIFAAAAAFTEMAGWMAHDTGRDELAQQHFDRSLPLARTSGDLTLAANIAASSSHLALQTGDPAQAAHLARTGLENLAHGRRIPSLTARLHTMHARALAATQQHDSAVRALDTAHTVLGTSVEAEHPWISPFDAAALASEAALVMRDLERYAEALAHAEQAISLRENGRARSLALSRITLVGIHVHRADLDAAVHFGLTLLTMSPNLSSIRVVHQLDELRAMLELHRDYPPVRDFLARFDDAARARMLLLADIITPHSGGTLP
ncbi:helix-turn-helix transcriptional regulator [Streptomyces sp. P9(2023)]|uniref:helix-turn-helix transcriptional regulator n=1 Tax=Streptomyces sp. P9(2023) TaxID=3064394 RepID=UPI0028F4583D|nr:helix-turn-helix transcriptional regulator [Streptomyces sp. P9(2023)]MDT9689482.1 helix-turn-helix transcriptional regulator [Streptomyces sp. P9(2023)]